RKYDHNPHEDDSPDHHKDQLYNIEFDPEKHHNLIENPNYGPEVKALQKELARLRKTTGLTPQPTRCPSMKASRRNCRIRKSGEPESKCLPHICPRPFRWRRWPIRRWFPEDCDITGWVQLEITARVSYQQRGVAGSHLRQRLLHCRG